MNKTTIKRDGASVSVYLDGPRWENRPCATLGAFSCKVAEAGRAVLADALKHVKEAGIDRVIGVKEVLPVITKRGCAACDQVRDDDLRMRRGLLALLRCNHRTCCVQLVHQIYRFTHGAIGNSQ